MMVLRIRMVWEKVLPPSSLNALSQAFPTAANADRPLVGQVENHLGETTKQIPDGRLPNPPANRSSLYYLLAPSSSIRVGVGEKG